MNEFKGNSDERTIELLQQRIDGFKHEFELGGKWAARIFPEATFHIDVEYRIAKQTRVINGITVPMCMTEKPEVNETYYTIDIDTGDTVDWRWEDDERNNSTLKNGLAFHKSLDAIETRHAILAGTRL